MASAAADLRDEAEHEIAIEIGGFAGRQTVSQDHRRGVELREILAAIPEKLAQQSFLDVPQVQHVPALRLPRTSEKWRMTTVTAYSGV